MENKNKFAIIGITFLAAAILLASQAHASLFESPAYEKTVWRNNGCGGTFASLFQLGTGKSMACRDGSDQQKTVSAPQLPVISRGNLLAPQAGRQRDADYTNSGRNPAGAQNNGLNVNFNVQNNQFNNEFNFNLDKIFGFQSNSGSSSQPQTGADIYRQKLLQQRQQQQQPRSRYDMHPELLSSRGNIFQQQQPRSRDNYNSQQPLDFQQLQRQLSNYIGKFGGSR